MGKVNVYENGEVVAQVEYNNNLDTWDGNNWTSGSTGHHLGITRLKDGRYVLIHGSQWQNESDWAEVIDENEAIQQVLKSGDEDLLDNLGLKEKAKKILIEEDTSIG
jgi:hypothetical protein